MLFGGILQFVTNNELLTVQMYQQARHFCCVETQDRNTYAALVMNVSIIILIVA